MFKLHHNFFCTCVSFSSRLDRVIIFYVIYLDSVLEGNHKYQYIKELLIGSFLTAISVLPQNIEITKGKRKSSGHGETRTHNPRVISTMLCRLSHATFDWMFVVYLI